jgi:hypothetical protein
MDFLNDFTDVIRNITYNTDNRWRPIQTGFILSTQSIISLYNYLLENYSLKELIIRRLTTDSVEILFSQIRGSGQTHPTSVDCKNSMKRISFYSHIDISENSNYSQDQSQLLKTIKNSKIENYMKQH